jgi:hypothetical protein
MALVRYHIRCPHAPILSWPGRGRLHLHCSRRPSTCWSSVCRNSHAASRAHPRRSLRMVPMPVESGRAASPIACSDQDRRHPVRLATDTRAHTAAIAHVGATSHSPLATAIAPALLQSGAQSTTPGPLLVHAAAADDGCAGSQWPLTRKWRESHGPGATSSQPCCPCAGIMPSHSSAALLPTNSHAPASRDRSPNGQTQSPAWSLPGGPSDCAVIFTTTPHVHPVYQSRARCCVAAPSLLASFQLALQLHGVSALASAHEAARLGPYRGPRK